MGSVLRFLDVDYSSRKLKIPNNSVHPFWGSSSQAGLCSFAVFYFLINNYSILKYFTSERHNSHSPCPVLFMLVSFIVFLQHKNMLGKTGLSITCGRRHLVNLYDNTAMLLILELGASNVIKF